MLRGRAGMGTVGRKNMRGWAGMGFQSTLQEGNGDTFPSPCSSLIGSQCSFLSVGVGVGVYILFRSVCNETSDVPMSYECVEVCWDL